MNAAAEQLAAAPFSAGWFEIVAGTQPAVATGFSLTMSGEYVNVPRLVAFTLTTDANVANRSARVEYDDGNGTIFASEGSGAVVQASTTSRQRFNAHRTGADWDQNNFVFAPLPDWPLAGGQKLQINLTSVQAGDQLSAIVLVFWRCLSSGGEVEGAAAAT